MRISTSPKTGRREKSPKNSSPVNSPVKEKKHFNRLLIDSMSASTDVQKDIISDVEKMRQELFNARLEIENLKSRIEKLESLKMV